MFHTFHGPNTMPGFSPPTTKLQLISSERATKIHRSYLKTGGTTVGCMNSPADQFCAQYPRSFYTLYIQHRSTAGLAEFVSTVPMCVYVGTRIILCLLNARLAFESRFKSIHVFRLYPPSMSLGACGEKGHSIGAVAKASSPHRYARGLSPFDFHVFMPSFLKNSVTSLNLLANLKRLCCTFTFVQSSDFEVWSVLS